MVKSFIKLSLVLASVVVVQGADAQNLLADKPVHTLGDAKTWTSSSGATYTFISDNLSKLVAVPTNTSNVYLFPEDGGGWATDDNKAIGIQGFYVDMEKATDVALVTTTWEGAAANAYSIYLTDEVPTTAILETTPTYTATGLGQYQNNTAMLPDGSKGRYLVFQPTDATNWGWGVKIRSIAATAPAEDELTTFSAAPGIVVLGQQAPMTLSIKNQNGLDIAADKVTVTVSDNATYTDGNLTINSGESATFTCKLGDKSLTATVYAATAPAAPAEADIKTPIFTNTVTDDNATAGYVTAYNGGAVDAGLITFANGEVAREFTDTRCVFFYNTATTGGWDADINPTAAGYKTLHLDIFAAKDATGSVTFERTTVIPGNNGFTLEGGKWNSIDVDLTDETMLHTMSVRFDAQNIVDILLANIYFTGAFVEGDVSAPVLADIVATPGVTSVKLALSATDDISDDIYYTISDGTKTYSVSGKSGQAVEYVVADLNPMTEYSFDVTASDGKNVSEPKSVSVTTGTLPAAPVPSEPADKVIAVFSAAYDADAVPAFDAWGSSAKASTVKDEDGNTVLMFTNYQGQYGGLVNLDVDVMNAQKLHLDIYSDVDGSLTIAPVWSGATDTPNKTVEISGGDWNSINIDLTDFGYPDYGTEVTQLALTNSTLPAFELDNFYFWTDGTLTLIDNVNAVDDTEVEYYNLQGIRVENPGNGIYIRRQGGKVSKILVR